MKSKMKKKLIAFMLCMVLVICNSVSILADTPAPETKTTQQVKETKTVKEEKASEESKTAAKESGTSEQSEEEKAPEVKTTEKKKETTKATTESKKATTEVAEETTTEGKEDKTEATTEAAEETSTTEEKKETSDSSEEDKKENKEATTTEGKEETAPTELTFENDDVIVTVSEVAEGAIPEGAELKVVPILKDDTETKEQYTEVEKQIQEKAESNGTQIKGFLAYDISFVDKNGNKKEPNGEVKVSIDYRDEILPAGLEKNQAINTEPTILHLEEDEDGNVKEVVDMNETNQVESMELGDSQQVKKVELTTTSFSVYTITWEEDTLKIQVVDSSGKTLGSNVGGKEYNWDKQNSINVKTIAEDIKEKQELSQDFNKAVYVKKGEEFQFTATQIYGFKYKEDDGGFWYCKEEDIDASSGWSRVEEGRVYFIFGDDPILDFNSIETVSTKDTIDINLFDYQVGEDGDESAGWDSNSGINFNHILKFVDSKGKDNQNININQIGGSGYINSGMVQNKLDSTGFPLLSSNKTGGNGSSLAYLFNSSTSEKTKSIYTNLDHLFKIDSDGYHVFNSAENYAYLPYSNGSFANDFIVGNIKGEESAGFYPFSQPTYSTIADIKKSSSEAVLDYTGVNHYYGMTIETTFIQPKGGKITTTDGTTQDMIFEFSGDDDVWVFIDDVLVLDLGGIHGAVSGTINFATGQVTRTNIKGEPASGTTIKNAFQTAGVSGDLEAGTNTFSDYTTHTIKFFYLERGNVDSNCMIKFNFPTIPKDSIAVAKEVTDQDGKGTDYAEDIDFEFNLKVENDNYANKQYALWENGKQVLDSEGNPVTGTTDNNGNFTLKHSQMAVFSELEANTQYQVTELGAYLDGYQVTVDDTSCTINKDTSGEETIYSATTGNRIVGDDASVVFRNAINNRTTLNIKKELAAGEQSTNDVFQIQVKIQGELYTGTYSIGNQSGYKAQNGIINLEAGETASISGLPYGASFEVEEVLDGSYLPTYTITGSGIYDKEVPTDSNGLSAVVGKITGEGGIVTVINREVKIENGTTQVTVTKTWDDEDKYAGLIPDSIKVTLYKDTNHNQKYDEGEPAVTEDANGNKISAETTLSKDNSWAHTWSNLPADTDFVITETYPEGFKWKTTEYSNDLSNLIELDRVTSCKNTEFNLGKNNMLLVKKTENDGYFLWSVYDLKLTDAQIKEITQAIMGMGLEGSGNLNLNNLEYDWGITQEDHGITLTEIENGWHLEFDKTSVWSQFWNFQYDRTENISLVNQIDKDLTTEVKVDKEWRGKNPRDNVTVELIPTVDGTQLTAEQIGWEGEVSVKLDENCEWKHTYQNLPYYYYDTASDTYKKVVYTVTETGMNNDHFIMKPGEVVGDYIFEIRTNGENDFTIINTRVDRWAIYKVSSTDDMLPLDRAEFSLTKKGETNPEYMGRSDFTGEVTWFDATNGEQVLYLEDGTYKLEETKAPSGYQKSDEIWTIIINNSALISITREDGTSVSPMQSKTREAEMVIRYAFTNDPLYALPSAGGPGIYWYTLSGALLMMGAALIVYKQQRKREVLLKK